MCWGFMGRRLVWKSVGLDEKFHKYVQAVDSTFSIAFRTADPFLQSSPRILLLKCSDRFSFDFSTKSHVIFCVLHAVVF